MLSALKQMDFEQFDGIVEVDETYFLYSQKGSVALAKLTSKNVLVTDAWRAYKRMQMKKG